MDFRGSRISIRAMVRVMVKVEFHGKLKLRVFDRFYFWDNRIAAIVAARKKTYGSDYFTENL